jgi:uncharacterized heparinase superfamily protein
METQAGTRAVAGAHPSDLKFSICAARRRLIFRAGLPKSARQFTRFRRDSARHPNWRLNESHCADQLHDK